MTTRRLSVKEADANLAAAKQKTVADASRINEAKATQTATEASIGMALATFRQAQTAVQSAQLDLSYTKIFAPCDGRVTRKAVEPGNYVQIGQQLMSIVPPEIWVVANFKESQLKNMRTNQPVLVEIDALGGKKFRAHVDSVQAGSGAAFSLLPPENATGNYVKVVQRVPVKILFDEPLPADHTIGPGLSVTPDVRVSDFEIPDWVIGLVALVVRVHCRFHFPVCGGSEAGLVRVRVKGNSAKAKNCLGKAAERMDCESPRLVGKIHEKVVAKWRAIHKLAIKCPA